MDLKQAKNEDTQQKADSNGMPGSTYTKNESKDFLENLTFVQVDPRVDAKSTGFKSRDAAVRREKLWKN